MHKTLFSPSMIETFRSCKRAYELAFLNYSSGNSKTTAGVILKRFVLRALAEINRGRLVTVNHVQKYMGQHWPVERMNEQIGDREAGIRAFLFAYKSLTRYVTQPYLPDGAEAVAIALKVRARIAHVRVYVEDTMDLVLWYPNERKLEIVDFQLKPLKQFDPAWPLPSHLITHYLGERLKTRWPFEKLVMTQLRIGVEGYQTVSATLDESIFRLHWSELVSTLEEMKVAKPENAKCCAGHEQGLCQQCQAVLPVVESSAVYRLSA